MVSKHYPRCRWLWNLFARITLISWVILQLSGRGIRRQKPLLETWVIFFLQFYFVSILISKAYLLGFDSDLDAFVSIWSHRSALRACTYCIVTCFHKTCELFWKLQIILRLFVFNKSSYTPEQLLTHFWYVNKILQQNLPAMASQPQLSPPQNWAIPNQRLLVLHVPPRLLSISYHVNHQSLGSQDRHEYTCVNLPGLPLARPGVLSHLFAVHEDASVWLPAFLNQPEFQGW